MLQEQRPQKFSSTPKSHKNTESLNESLYPKLDDLGAESALELKPQKLSFSEKNFIAGNNFSCRPNHFSS